jgi:hypothetical protein
MVELILLWKRLKKVSKGSKEEEEEQWKRPTCVFRVEGRLVSRLSISLRHTPTDVPSRLQLPGP